MFQWVCRDVLNVDTAKVTRGGQPQMSQKIDEAMRKVCRPRTKARRNAGA